MDVIEHAILPEWGKHPDKVDGGTLTLRYRVYPDGRIADLKITSTTGNRFLEETSLRSMQGVKLPPVPSAVLGHEPFLEMEAHVKPQDEAEDLNVLGQEYATNATNVARQLLLAEFSKHPERIHHLLITFAFQVDAAGRPHDVKVVSKNPDAWAVDTAHRALSAGKFPPIPEKIVQSGSGLVNIGGDFSADAP